jgi:ATP-dependent Clp protease ATP-binding subunit ClpC
MRIKTMTAPPRYRELEDRSRGAQRQGSLDRGQEFEKAAAARRAQALRRSAARGELARRGGRRRAARDRREEIADIVSMWTGIPVFKLTEAESQKLIRMEDEAQA